MNAADRECAVRLFIALELPDSWRGEAEAIQRRLLRDFEAELRPVRREQIHVTVRFLGEVEPAAAARLARTIEATRIPEVALSLAAAGTFGQPARTSVAWLGVDIDAADQQGLLAAVDEAIRGAGLAPPDQAWRPHLTLARVRRPVDARRRREIARAVRDLPRPELPPAVANRVSLIRSQLGNPAPRHKLLARSAVS